MKFSSLVFIFMFTLPSWAQEAPGAPGISPRWASPQKVAIGTSYEAYDLDGKYSGLSETAPISKVWFTIADGILTETYYPMVDTAQSQETQLFITDGKTFVEEEKNGTHYIDWPEPKAPLIRIVTEDPKKRYKIIKHYFSHPGKNIVYVQYEIQKYSPDLEVYLSHHPRAFNTGYHDNGKILDSSWMAGDGPYTQILTTSIPFEKSTVGFMGKSDGEKDLKNTFQLKKIFTSATNGHIGFLGMIPKDVTSFSIALCFGSSQEEAFRLSQQAFSENLDKIKNQYVNDWKSYFKSITDLSSLSQDSGDVFYRSVTTLKSHEDKTHAGGIVASLSIPWGDQSPENLHNQLTKQNISPLFSEKRGTGGYHLIWPRDLFQAARGFMSIHDYDAAKACLRYLSKIQYTSDGGQWNYGMRTMPRKGAFPQNTWIDGTPFWEGLQIDDVAYPIILDWHLWQVGAIDLSEFWPMVESAASFIGQYGPWTAQERWEENFGISPSTIASEISALVCAADMATRFGQTDLAKRWIKIADQWSLTPNDNIEAWTFTTQGLWGNGRYYVRVDGASHLSSTEPDYLATWDPNDNKKVMLANFSGTYFEKEIMDGGFLELVRYGVRSPTNEYILDSISELDDKIKVQTPYGPAWYRYLHDGYGEDGRGRLWTFLTGERAQYELSLLLKRNTNPKVIQKTLDYYIHTLESFTNEGHLFSEQIWDQGENIGRSTGSATPLLWTHAEYLKLLRSKETLTPFDVIPIVAERYQEY